MRVTTINLLFSSLALLGSGQQPAITEELVETRNQHIAGMKEEAPQPRHQLRKTTQIQRAACWLDLPWTCKCRPNTPCRDEQGTCRRHEDCLSGLRCGHSKCKQFDTNLSYFSYNCCYKPKKNKQTTPKKIIPTASKEIQITAPKEIQPTVSKKTPLKALKKILLTVSKKMPTAETTKIPAIASRTIPPIGFAIASSTETAATILPRAFNNVLRAVCVDGAPWKCACSTYRPCWEGEGRCWKADDCLHDLQCGNQNCRAQHKDASYFSNCCYKPNTQPSK